MNLCLCVDLIMTIYDPFSPAYRRTNLYYLFSVATSLVLVFVITGVGASQSAMTKEIEFDCLSSTSTG